MHELALDAQVAVDNCGWAQFTDAFICVHLFAQEKRSYFVTIVKRA